MSEKPLVSVLMPAYNQAEYVSEAIQSLLTQTYTNWELAVVDDGSPDNVAEIVKKYTDSDPRIKFYHTENQGVSAARNFAAAHTSGELILPLDADDIFEPEYMELCVKKFTEDSSVKVVYCNWQMFGAQTDSPPLSYKGYEDLLISNTIFSAAMYRRSDFESIGGYDTLIPFGFEDWDFWISLLDKNSKVYQIPRKLFNYRIKAASRSVDINIENNQRITREYIYKKHLADYMECFPDFINILRRLQYLERRNKKWEKRSLPSRLWHAIKGTI